MNASILLPHYYRKIGWFILVSGMLLGILALSGYEPALLNAKVFSFVSSELFGPSHYFQFVQANLLLSLSAVLFIAGGLFIGFSKEKIEDEFIASIRLSSLKWAVIIHYLLLLSAFLFIYGTAFLTVMLLNMFTTLIIYIARYYYLCYKYSKTNIA